MAVVELVHLTGPPVRFIEGRPVLATNQFYVGFNRTGEPEPQPDSSTVSITPII
jgi:hypothetical protein